MTAAYREFDEAAEARALDARLRHAEPQEVLREAVARFGGRLALVSSFGAESAVLLHMAAQIRPDIPVLFLDTGMLFGQTLDYRKSLAATLGLTDVRDLRPFHQDLAVHDPDQKLHQSDVDACCHIRKVIPLDHALQDFDAWITGRKRFHGGDRLRLKVVEYADGTKGTVLQIDGHVADDTFAARVEGEKKPQSCLFWLPPPPGAAFLEALSSHVETFLATGKPPYPVERTLLTSGILAYALESRANGSKRLETPDLDVRYHPPTDSGFIRGDYVNPVK